MTLMAWYSDEEFVFRRDCGEKKHVAASAHKQRTHCGKGGRVRFPSDNLTRKELNAMNGEVKSYSLGEVRTWEDFKNLPDSMKVNYIIWIRDKFQAPDTAIAELLGVAVNTLSMYLIDLKVGASKSGLVWDKEGFNRWAYPEKYEKEAINPIDSVEFYGLTDEGKIAYISAIRERFNAPDTAIADMLKINRRTICAVVNKLGLGRGKDFKNRKWDKEAFYAWAGIEETAETICESVCEPAEAPVSDETGIVDTEVMEDTETAEALDQAETANVITIEKEKTEGENKCSVVNAIPKSGNMVFDCDFSAALRTLDILLGNSHVRLKVEWEVIPE